MITKFARLKFELFTKPSKLDFLRVHQKLNGVNAGEVFVGSFGYKTKAKYGIVGSLE